MNDKTLGWADIKASMRPVGTENENIGFHVDIPDNWKQGRTTYGGLAAALMYASAVKKFDDLPPLRSAIINFVGPITDSPLLSANLERRGRNVTNLSAAAHIGEQSVGRADFLFGAGRDSNVIVDFPSPPTLSPEDAEPFTPEAALRLVPNFFHNFETRLVAGSRPLMGNEGYIRTWSRHKDPRSHEGVDSLLCIGDVLPPAAMPLMRTFSPVSSMSWMFNLLTDNPQTEDGWWQIESRLTAAQGGYSSQVMRIWNSAGELVAEGMQSIAIFDG